MGRITRREMLRRSAAGLALGLSSAAGVFGLRRPRAWADTPRRPNILVIMSDEHNAGVTGAYGNKLARTPNLDRLAERGVTFESCYTNSPLCVPCRASFTAGKYISRIGAWSNDCELPGADYPSLPRTLNAAGYESFLCGKQHYAGSRRYGFTDVGGNFNNHTKTGKGGRRPPDNLTAKGLSARFDEFRVGDKSGVIKHDRKVTEGTIEFLRQRKGDGKPFFLFSGYLAPHFPLIVPEEFYKHYEGKVPPPVIPEGHLQGQPLNYKHLRAGFQVANVPQEIVRKGRELYYGFTEWVDHEIGQVLKALGDSRLAEQTVVIYTTDHGENMGEHGRWWKNCMYEHAARVPLIVSWPARWADGQRRTAACSLVDVVRTLAELGGADVPQDWNGSSLCGWLDKADAPWKDLAVSEYYAHNIASGYAMLRTGPHKYVYHIAADEQHPAERELYDLKADPGEFTNLAARAEQQALIGELHVKLVKELGEDPEVTEKRCRSDYAKGYEKPIK